jgi:hypothetical protein
LAVSLFLAPITEPNMPPLDESGKLLWAPNVIRGIPSWAFQIIMVLVPVTVFLLYAIYSIPSNLFPNANKDPNDVTSSMVAEDTTLDTKERTSERFLVGKDTRVPSCSVSDSRCSSVDKDIDQTGSPPFRSLEDA